jgi:hypothetical protein
MTTSEHRPLLRGPKCGRFTQVWLYLFLFNLISFSENILICLKVQLNGSIYRIFVSIVKWSWDNHDEEGPKDLGNLEFLQMLYIQFY